MKFCYYAFSDTPGLNTCSMRSEEFPLLVNCTGNFVANKPFSTDNTGGREDFYLLYIIKGTMTVLLHEQEELATVGDILVFPPRFRYRYRYDGNAPLEYFFLHFTGSYAKRLLEECSLTPLPCLRHTKDNCRISDCFHHLFHCVEEQSPLQQQELACALEQILLAIARNLTYDNRLKQDHTLERTLRTIHSAYHTELKIPDLAKAEQLSHSRFIEIFRQKTGVSPSAYLIRLRMQIACDLLENTDIAVKQIAPMVGYGDPLFFSKLFKKHIGKSPKIYREQQKTKNAPHHSEKIR